MTVFTQKEKFIFQFLIISVAVGLGVGTIRKTYFKPDYSLHNENEISEFQSKSADIIESDMNKDDAIIAKTDDIKHKITVKLIDINTAPKIDLLTLPKIGPVTAERIIRYREDYGSFKSIDDLLKVKGIGVITLKKLKPFIKIDSYENKIK